MIPLTKIDKKVLIILVVILVLAVLVGLAAYRYLTSSAPTVQNSAGGVNTEAPSENNPETPQIEIQAETDGTNSQGGLLICLDKCGDGVCQKPDSACDPKSLNCVCSETPQECPQDCK